MSETKKEVTFETVTGNPQPFYEKYSRQLLIGAIAVIVVAGAYLAYKYLYQAPRAQKAADAIFKAEQYLAQDSLQLALNGDATNPGFLKVIRNYSGTPSANLAHLYAGQAYLQLGDYANAVKYLKDFDANGALQVQARVHGMLGDAYSEQKKNDEAITEYKKAASLFPADQAGASEYLFRAASLLELAGKNQEAIALYQEIKDRFPRTERGYVVEKYLARLGVTQ